MLTEDSRELRNENTICCPIIKVSKIVLLRKCSKKNGHF